MSRIALLVGASLVSAPALAADLPQCAGPVEIGKAAITRVEKNGVMILTDGRAIKLEGIRLPGGAADHAPQFIADQALAELNALTDGHKLTLTAVVPKEDRYDRVRAQAFADGDWLQAEMLRRGLARVNISPDRIECASELYAAEAQGRSKRAGLWASSAYAIRNAVNVAADTGTFQVVEGKVTVAEVRNGAAYLDFGSNWKGDFNVTISASDMKLFRILGVDPRGYAGKTVRVRGIVQHMDGPAIAIANPEMVEVVQ